jgi:predicted ATP-binding protein involved in virulence
MRMPHMQIKRIKWKNHPILGGLLLDLVNTSSGSPYETIVLAGENGTGKTTILEEISSFLNAGPFSNYEYVEYVVNDKTYKAIPTTDGSTHPNFFDLQDADGNIANIRYDRNNNSHNLESNVTDLRYYGCVFSRARSDYKTNKITATSTSALDTKKHDIDTTDDFTSLKQLIVDVVNQDNSDYTENNKVLGSNPKTWADFYPTSKIFRFKNSFDNFFDGLIYERVVDEPGEKIINFTKNGASIPVDKLSTGEKQIVFRGVYLLKNSNVLEGAVIMIDEPELSMHPKWQKKILGYYKDLFKQSGTLKAQLFFATHSDHVLNTALCDQSENIVIVLEENGGTITTKKINSPSVLPSITSAETNYLAFDIISHDYHIELYSWLQDKTSNATIKSCDDFIKMSPHYDPVIHLRPSSFKNTTYNTLPTYVRNAIHHPDSGNTFTESDLRAAVSLLIKLCR